jgi:hypothetical protein
MDSNAGSIIGQDIYLGFAVRLNHGSIAEVQDGEMGLASALVWQPDLVPVRRNRPRCRCAKSRQATLEGSTRRQQTIQCHNVPSLNTHCYLYYHHLPRE